MPETEDQTIKVFHSMPKGSDTAIVAFSSHGTRPDRFHYFPLGELLPEVSILLVRDPSDNWYNTGLPGVGDDVEAIAARIRAELDAIGAKRAITLGTSMGGYAAILFGCLIGAERVVALVPQTLLDPGLPLWTPSADVKLQVPDLVPVVREAPETEIELIIGLDDLVDIFHAQRVASSPSVRILGLRGADHAFSRRLHEKDEYWPFVTTLLEGDMPSICEVELGFPPDVVDQITDAIFAWHGIGPTATLSKLVRLCQKYPDWAAPRFALAKGLEAVRPLSEKH